MVRTVHTICGKLWVKKTMHTICGKLW